MSTITFIGGPFDGDQRVVDPGISELFEHGVVLRSDAGGLSKRYAVYLPNGRGDVEFHAYAPSLEAGMAMLPKENTR